MCEDKAIGVILVLLSVLDVDDSVVILIDIKSRVVFGGRFVALAVDALELDELNLCITNEALSHSDSCEGCNSESLVHF